MWGIKELINKYQEKHFWKGAEVGFKEGFKRGQRGFISSNPNVYGKFHEVFNQTLALAVRANQESYKKFGPHSRIANAEILSRSCSYKIGERSCILLQATFSLCEDGWASVTPVLIRSMLECLLNLYLILKDHNDYWAFRFFSHGFLNDLINDSDNDVKEEARREVDKLLAQLNGPDLARAKDYEKKFIERGKANLYWYKPDFSNAREILPAGLYFIYKSFSSSVHSGLMGMNLFKDEPDKVDINPRNDRNSIKKALAGASRITYEITNIRIQHESLNLATEANKLLTTISELQKFM